MMSLKRPKSGKKRRANLDFQRRLKEKEELEKQQREQEHQRSLFVVEQGQSQAKVNPAFKVSLAEAIAIRLPMLQPFLSRKLGKEFSTDDVLHCSESLYLFCEDIALILKKEGIAIQN